MATKRIEETGTTAIDASPKLKSKMSPADLAPNLADSIVITKQYTYWIGVTSECPGNHLSCGGINFPKTTDLMEDDPMKPGSMRRIPQIGTLHPLTARQMKSVMEALPFRIIRFTESEEGKPRKGYPVRIPTPERIEQAKKNRTTLPEYIQQAGDEWAAKYMFAVLCKDQDDPKRGLEYPPTLAEAGLEWPDQMD